MKRRLFVKQFGRGISSSVLFPGKINPTSEWDLSYTYPMPGSLEELRNEDGLVALRILLEGRSETPFERITGKIHLKGGKLSRIRSYFNLYHDQVDTARYTFDLSAFNKDQHILACWLDSVTENSVLMVKINKQTYRFMLSEIIDNSELVREDEKIRITVNGLPYHEIGVINPQKVGIPSDPTSYRFVIMADPQGGNPLEPKNETTRVKIHNAFVEQSIELANALDPASLFTLVLGDFTDSIGQAGNFNQMIKFYKKLEHPYLLEIGNHETPYGAIFTPGYNMSEFSNYFAAQKKINGLEKLLYSFDIGKWHFIVWPDPLRNNFWETHPHYFDWLEHDLDKNRERPVFFFQHVPIHPIGINPLVSYVNPVHINRILFDILSRYGNVRYAFSGHVHIPLRASSKTAISYRDIRLINLPPAGYRPRAFGEQDYYGGPSQGICLVDVDGDQAEVHFQTVTKEIFRYPETFRDYSAEMDPLWFKYKWEMEGSEEIINGGFENGLSAWHSSFIYMEDHNPSNKKEALPAPDRKGRALYLFTRKRGYDTPGQDRLPQTLNQITQVIKATPGKVPYIRLAFRIDGSHYFPKSWNGGFLWLEGYRGRHLVLSQVYVLGKGIYSLAGSYGRNVNSTFYDITDEPDVWHEVLINVADDFKNSHEDQTLLSIDINRYAINLGTWTINDGYQQEIGVYIDDVIMDFNFIDHAGGSRLDDKPIRLLDTDNIFIPQIGHEAGEHKYASQSELYPY
jgi:hypothetical protein